jgi:hypothetical protein
MLTISIFRSIGAATLVAVLGGCEGDDNSLPGPVDAGSHADAASNHDGGADASASGDASGEAGTSADAAADAVAQADGAGETSTEMDAGDATIEDAGVNDGAVDALPPAEAGDSE